MAITYHSGRRTQGLSSDLEGLKAYWKMNDSSGKLLNTASSQGDASLSSSDLTISGTTGYGVTGHVSGVNAYSFTDADGNKAVADNSPSDWNFLTNSGNKFTITLWLKVDSNSVNADFIGTGGSGANDFGIRYRGAVSDKKFAIFFSNEGEKITSTSTTLTDTNWHFYMIQYDDSVGTLRFQKDAVAVEEFTGLNLTSTGYPTTALSFGDSQGSTSETGGDIQEVTVWDRLLTTAEIAQIYNSNSGAQLQNTTIETGGRPTNVQIGSRYEETNTRKMYYYSDTPTLSYDLSTSTSWTTTGSNCSVNTTGQYLEGSSSTDNDRATKALGLTLSDTKFVVRQKMQLTDVTTGGNGQLYFGYTDKDNSTTVLGNRDGIGITIRTGADFLHTYALNQAWQSAETLTTTPTETTYYLEIIRNSPTEMTMKLFDNANYSGTATETVTNTISSSINGLDHITIGGWDNGATGNITARFSNIEIYNNVSTVSGFKEWKELGT